MQISHELWTFCYLAFKVTNKLLFVKIKVFGKNVEVSNICENTKEQAGAELGQAQYKIG